MKIRTKAKDCQLTVRVKFSIGEKVDKIDLENFARKYIRGFLKFKQMKKGTIEYYGPIGISLYERMKNPISKYDFFFIVEQVVDATQKLQNQQVSVNKVLWNLQNIFINEVTKEVQFLYVPLSNTDKSVDMLEFIENLIYAVKPLEEEQSDYLSQFVYFIKSMTAYESGRIEQYISRVDRTIVNTIKKHNVGESGFMTDKKQHYYEHYNNQTEDEEATGLLASNEEATGLLVGDEEATGLLLEDCDETALLKEEQVVARLASLYRVLTMETIPINKPVFRLGKERSYVDYFVTNNNAVSRSHADFITRGGRYFVIDRNSKNKTYINNQPIPVQTEVEIFDGYEIRLANEEFVFHI